MGNKKCKWYLNISKEEFKKIYAGTEVLKDISLFETEPDSDGDFILNYLPSKLWRLNNLYVIRDKVGTKLNFNLHRAQHISYANTLLHPRQIVLKSRQQGISTLWLISFFDDALFIDNMSCGLMAQNADAASDLLTRVTNAWDDLDQNIKNFLNIRRIVNNSKVTEFSNGSKMYVRTSFRSGTLTRLHISELGKIANKYPEKAKETNTGSLQAIKAGNTVIIESTAEGRDNLFAKKWYTAANHIGPRSDMHFYPLFLSWTNDPDCVIPIEVRPMKDDIEYINLVERDLNIKLTNKQKWWSYSKREELGEDFDQEYPYNPEAAFSQARDGTYYGKLFKELRDSGRVIPQETIFEPELKVNVSFDIGMSDAFVMLFWQEDTAVSGKLQIRLIDAYINSGEGLSHYVKVLRGKNYRYDRFILPHDAKKRELGANKSIAGQLKDLGLTRQKVLSRDEIIDGIQAVREMIPNLWVSEHLDIVMSAFENYTKEWDGNRGVWKDKPLHDEHSDPMDAARYYAMYRIRSIISSKRKEFKSKNQSNVVDGMAI